MARTVITKPPEALMGAPNEDVFAYLKGMSAHSDIVEPLCKAVKSLPGVEFHCSDRQRYGYVVASVKGTVFGAAAGMQGLYLRLSPEDEGAAVARGARSTSLLGSGWIFLELSGGGELAESVDELALQAFRYAEAPSNNSLERTREE